MKLTRFNKISLLYVVLIIVSFSCYDNKTKKSEPNKSLEKNITTQPISPNKSTKPENGITVSPSRKNCSDPEVNYEARQDINFELHPSILIKNNCPTQTIVTLRCLINLNLVDSESESIKVFKNLNLGPQKSINITLNIPRNSSSGSATNIVVEMMDYYTSDGEYHSTYVYEKKKMIELQEGIKKQYPDLKFQ